MEHLQFTIENYHDIEDVCGFEPIVPPLYGYI